MQPQEVVARLQPSDEYFKASGHRHLCRNERRSIGSYAAGGRMMVVTRQEPSACEEARENAPKAIKRPNIDAEIIKYAKDWPDFEAIAEKVR